MFEIDPAKLLIIGIVMLIFIKPEDLPGVVRQIGHAIGKLRKMTTHFQAHIQETLRETHVEIPLEKWKEEGENLPPTHRSGPELPQLKLPKEK